MKTLTFKALAILQMVFGLFITYFSWYLADTKTHTPPVSSGGTIWVTTPPPSTELEFVILLLGAAVIACGLVQRLTRVRFSILQIVSGIIVAGIAAFLYDRANGLNYGERSTIYYIAYLLLFIGLAVSAVGLVQFRKALSEKMETGYIKYSKRLSLIIAGGLAFGLGSAVFIASYNIPAWVPWGGVMLMGALGGLGLGLALRISAGKATIMALACASGFLVGHVAGKWAIAYIAGDILHRFDIPVSIFYFLLGGIMGAAGGAMLGLVMRDKRLIVGLAVAGFLAFGIGYGLLSINLGYERKITEHLTEFIIINTVGGMALGATIEHFIKRKGTVLLRRVIT